MLGLCRNVKLSKLLIKHLNITSFIVFILYLLDIRSYYIVLELNILASTGYLFSIISTCLTLFSLIVIINEPPYTNATGFTTFVRIKIKNDNLIKKN